MDRMKPVAVFGAMFCAAVVVSTFPGAAAAQTVQVIHSFSGCGPVGCAEDNDGAYPRSALVRGPDGSLYGTTTDFPTGGLGTIFQIPTTGGKVQLFNFSAPVSPPSPIWVGPNGCFPGWNWSLGTGADGAFYGAADGCGANNGGTLFRITAGGSFTKLYDFVPTDLATANGWNPLSGLVQGLSGAFYGTSSGPTGYGRVYRFDVGGSDPTLYGFTGSEGGAPPSGNLTLASDGNLYGTAASAFYQRGAVYRITPADTFELLHALDGSVGWAPNGALIQGTDGHLYGTSSGGPGGAGGTGTVFRITLAGAASLVHDFGADPAVEGRLPQAPLLQTPDGDFYGTTQAGGALDQGTIFRMTPAGDLTVLHSFAGPDGSRPFGGLVQGDDGHLYGTTHSGGDHNLGVVFRLVLPVADVTLRSPNGGEKLFVNTPWTIQWDVAGATSIDVDISTNGGVTYVPIAECTGLPGSATSCAWLPTGLATTTARVRVRAHGAAGETAMDASDASFTISTAVPSVTVTAPNTAVTWMVGSVQQVRWNHNLGVQSLVQIEVSRDSGGSWIPVGLPVRNTSPTSGTFVWTVTGPATTSALVRISWRDGPIADVSNTTFSILQPTLTVTSPNTAVSWGIGGTRALTWTHNIPTGGRVNIDLSRDEGATWTSIATAVPNSASRSGTYSWLVTGPVTAAARLRISWDLDSTVSDTSDVSFAIADPVVTVVSPNTAASWRIGNTYSVKVSHNLGPGQAIGLDLTRDGGASWEPLTVVTTASSTTTSFSWLVSGPPTAAARVRARWEAKPDVRDESNVHFSVLTRVTVVTPNTNVSWTVGSARSIAWTHNLGVSETVNIELSRDGGESWEALALGVANATATTGSFSWTVTGPPTLMAIVRIAWMPDPAASDVSNVTFRIQ